MENNNTSENGQDEQRPNEDTIIQLLEIRLSKDYQGTY